MCENCKIILAIIQFVDHNPAPQMDHVLWRKLIVNTSERRGGGSVGVRKFLLAQTIKN